MTLAEAARLLSLSPDAPASEVRESYARAVKADHPDHGGNGSLLATLKAARDTLLCQDTVSSCKFCRGSGRVRFRFGVQACTACGGSGDQP